MLAEDNPVTKNGQTFSDAELGVQFTEIFIKKPENVTLLLGLLEVSLECEIQNFLLQRTIRVRS